MSERASANLVSLGILASAGTGKTYQLAQRYLALLALGGEAGASAGSMIALTFTRKAAREFAQRIVTTLAEAAADEQKAQALAARLQQVWRGEQRDPQFGNLPALVDGAPRFPQLSQGFFVRLLGEFLTELDKLQLTTLDAFFTHLARTCAHELGMAGFRLLEQAELQAAQERVLAEIFEQRGSAQRFQTIEQALLRSLAGREELRWKQHLQQMIGRGSGLWWEFSQEEFWGNFAHDYQSLSAAEAKQCLQRIDELLCGQGVEFEREGKQADQARQSLWDYANWLIGAGGAAAGASVDGGVLGKRLRQEGLNLGEAALELSYYKKPVRISQPLAQEFRRLVEHFLAAELALVCERSRALGELLAEVDGLYAQRVRARGELSFAEMGALLAGLPLLPQREPFELIALDWQARLDASLEHWFLDEFQDTSRLQWQVLKDTLEEIVQEPGGRRTLFLVGDPKQAIYGWRGGDDRLFTELWQDEGWQKQVQRWGMARSFRSAPAVLELVNEAFLQPSWESFAEVPEGLAKRWEFAEHQAAIEAEGEARVWQVAEASQLEQGADQAEERAEEDAIDPLWRAAAELILEAGVVERQISVAVLVRRGQTALEGGEALRRLFALQGVELAVEVEGEAALSEDSPLGLLLRDLFAWLEKPAERFAWQHLQMSPLAELIAESGGEEGFWRVLWQHWQRGAAEAVLEFVEPSLRELDLGAYQEQRLSNWQALARKWVQQGGGTLASWAQVVAESRQREYAAGGAVQVMTVHKAKGLEWDMVILAELGERVGWTSLGRLESLQRSDMPERGQQGMVLVNPSSLLLEWEPRLRELASNWQQQQAYEALCVQYVAMTRAQKAVHLLLPPLAKTWQKRIAKEGAAELPLRSDFWLRVALGELFEPAEFGSGEVKSLLKEASSSTANWRQQRPLRHRLELAATREFQLGKARASRRRRQASRQGEGVARSAAALAGVAYGTAVHEWAARLPLAGAALEAEFFLPAEQASAREQQAAAAVEQAWKQADLGWAWGGESEAGEAWELWTERSFEILEAEEWISGVFDRVMLRREQGGDLREVRLLEIKTDAVEEAAELVRRHREQLSLYQRVLGRLLGIESQRIEAKFLWLPAEGEALLVDLLNS